MSRVAAWRRQLNAYLQQVLDLLIRYEDCSIAQQSYKSDFFKIWADAFINGFCTTNFRIDPETNNAVRNKEQRPRMDCGSILAFLREKGYLNSKRRNIKREGNAEYLCTWWTEWTFALRQKMPRKKRKRKPNPPGSAGLLS